MKKQAIKKLGGNRGFTLIEILVVIGLIAVLAAVVIIAINPARQFAQGRNSQRTSNVNSILNGIGQNLADNKGIFTCSGAAHTIPVAATTISAAAEDLRPCIVPAYMPELPVDPSNGTPWDGTTYNTQYTVARDATTQRITVCAPGGVEPAIPGSAAICQTR